MNNTYLGDFLRLDNGSNTVGFIVTRVRNADTLDSPSVTEGRATNLQGQVPHESLEDLERYPLGRVHLTLKMLF